MSFADSMLGSMRHGPVNSNMPAYGLAKATAAVPVRRSRETAAQRAGQPGAQEPPAVPSY